uniref:CCHC-type domain-containing protein n=1 Tax=Setaria viridis TaxID=4556 RepID=A0A4U6VU86_SETVI|nr:hypothetical protein SEVIR_2G171700v2 [Setaria viridis]
MASFKFVQSHGIAFAAKVRDLLGSQVVHPPSSQQQGFSLVIAFSRNNFRLTPASVSHCLQAVLGGHASGLHVSHLDQQVYKFHVSSKHVGFLCLDLKDFSCDGFHVGFFFNNSSGLAHAYTFAKKYSGSAYHWELVRPRKGKAVSLISDESNLNSNSFWNVEFKNAASYGKMTQAFSGHRSNGSSSQAVKDFRADSSPSLASKAHLSSGSSRSFVDVVKMNSGNTVPLSGANLVPLRRRSIHRNSVSLGGAKFNPRPSFLAPKKARPSVFQRLVFPNSNRSRLLENRSAVACWPIASRIFSSALAGSRDLMCSRCLSPNHQRSSCVNRICCWHCKKKGHTRNDCKLYHDLQSFIKRCGSAALFPQASQLVTGPLIAISPGSRPAHLQASGPLHPPNLLPPPGWHRNRRSCSDPFVFVGSPPLRQLSPTSVNLHTYHPLSLPPAPMAFLNVDPQPMMLAGFNRVIIQGCQQFARVVIPRATPRNENLAIVTVTNLPPGEILFGPLRNVILQFLEHDLGLEVLDIQRCPFGRGQAYVRLGRPSDRDALIAQSPHFRNGFAFSFVQHNRAANARRVNFNRECWLMLIGFPLDSCSIREIEVAIRSFGRMILWQKDNVLARIIIKARVTELIDIPHYLILSKGDDFEGVSYTVQCEIL